MSDLPETNSTEALRWLEHAREELLTARRVAGDANRGADDAIVLEHARSTGQIIVISNHDPIVLCTERQDGEPISM